jgi:Flp pilus assembly protein TadB
VSSRPSRSAPTGGREPFEDHAPQHEGGWTPIEYNRSARRHERAPHGSPGSIHHHRRRAAAAQARSRRLLAIDLALGLALALLAIALAPGLAIVAILAVAGLLACAASLAYGRVRRPRR